MTKTHKQDFSTPSGCCPRSQLKYVYGTPFKPPYFLHPYVNFYLPLMSGQKIFELKRIKDPTRPPLLPKMERSKMSLYIRYGWYGY